MNKHEELENWKSLQYRIREEGIEYCFKHYSDFSEIEDEQFHQLRNSMLEIMDLVDMYVIGKIDELETQILEEDE
jgi:hypothetical protein